MEFLIKDNGSYITLNKDKLLDKKSGGEGDVFRYNDSAIKIYNNEDVIRLKEDEAKILTDISTKRILLPDKLLYTKEDGKVSFNGYKISNYINDTKPITEISNLESSKLIEELKLIYKDIDNISLNDVFLCDLDTVDNILFNGNIYFVDPGKHYVNYPLDYYYLKIENEHVMDEALIFHILFLQDNYYFLKENTMNVINNHIGEFDPYFYNMAHYIIKNIYFSEKVDFKFKKYKNFLEYVLEIISNYGTLNNYRATLIKEALDNKNNFVDKDEIKFLRKIIK